eukprot:9983879-Lingulodinium_polyedra.AAC.1
MDDAGARILGASGVSGALDKLRLFREASGLECVERSCVVVLAILWTALMPSRKARCRSGK